MKKNKKIKKQKNKKEINTIHRLKLAGLVGLLIILTLYVVGRLFWIEFKMRDDLLEKAYRQQTLNKIITPKRGTIFDSTGEKILAISSLVDNVYINSTQVEAKNKTLLATTLAQIFELDYTDTLEKINSDNKNILIAKKVNSDKIDAFKKWMQDNKYYAGITITEDTKRLYPYNNLASSLIGTCGYEGQGLEGIEKTWNSLLTGTPGKIVTSRTTLNDEISNKEQISVPVENGSNIVLTINAEIQAVAEKYLKEAVINNNCEDGGNVIMMNPKTGDILAMANYSDYNLNNPFELTGSYENVYSMWRNTNIADNYEPGSTFKLLTSAIALEENLVETDTKNDFYCSGSEIVEGWPIPISCWRKENPHLHQSLREALSNSCNPSFIQLGRRIGISTFYKYLQGFNLLGNTGVDLVGERVGNFVAENKMQAIELATLSFGQRFTITRLQLINAVSSFANNGILMQPRIVKEIIDSDTGAIETVPIKEIRQVVSKDTSDKMLSLMESVVETGTGGPAKVKGYSVGGKSGTSEVGIGTDIFTASFIGVSTINNPEVVVLVTLNNPRQKDYQGGKLAGTVVSKILTEVMPIIEL